MAREPAITRERAGAAAERHAAAFDTVTGAAVGVVWEGELVFTRTWGVAEVETGRPVTPETNFRLASVTKQFTAMAVLLLVEDGLLGLDEPLEAFFVDLPGWCGQITARQLLTHTSGLPDYEDLIPSSAAGSTSLQLQNRQVLHLIMDARGPLSAPGARYHYSNTGYALLSEIVEIRAGVSFARFMRSRIFEPLRMHNSRVQERGITDIPERAYGHTKQTDGTFLRTDQNETSAVLGDGAVYSSIADLARWDAALRAGLAARVAGLPSPAMLREAMTPHVHDPVRNVGYGFGWRISPAPPPPPPAPATPAALPGWTNIWHTGETIGFRTIIDRWGPDWRPEAGDFSRRGAAGLRPEVSILRPALTVIILVNQENDVPSLKEVSERIAADLLAPSVR